MALQSPFFGKRDADNHTTRPLQSSGPSGGITSATAAAPGSTAASTSAAPQGLTSSSASSSTLPASLTRAGQASTQAAAAPTAEGSSAKLTVGPNIKLKGVEITDCDTLVVEGTVEATMDSRVIHIAEQGAFSGSADIDIAEIHGAFDGKLTVRQKLVIHSTGRVTGTVRYGRLVIEDGGQLAGDVALGGHTPMQATLLAA
jgi:cytoskeletal protein CcmA (bactofilin family)